MIKQPIPMQFHDAHENKPPPFLYTSVVTLAFALVTLTPSCFARATISILFLDETACAILVFVSLAASNFQECDRCSVLSGESLVVHKEEVNIADIVDEKCLVARWCQMACLLVGTKTNLSNLISLGTHSSFTIVARKFSCIFSRATMHLIVFQTYRWHNHLALEPSSDSVVNTLWLSPAGIETFVGIALMSVETLRACVNP